MRKRRRLANKLTIMVCAVLVAVSAFFYAPMEVHAESSTNVSSISVDDYVFSSGDISQSVPDKYYRYIAPFRLYEDTPFDFSPFLSDGEGFYEVTFDITVNMSSDTWEAPWWIDSVFYYSVSGSNYQVSQWSSWDVYSDYSFSYDNAKIIVNSDDCLMTSRYSSVPMFSNSHSAINVTCNYELTDIKVKKLSSTDSEEYQSGYNAGYSAGEQAGYGNGYSNGFADGEASVDTDAIYDEAFQAGKNSVDTQSYYDAGYQAGYDAAYSEGYESGYDVGYQSAMDRIENWGADTSDYPLLIQQTDGTFDLQFDFIEEGSDEAVYSDYDDYERYYTGIEFNPNHTYRLDFTYHDFSYEYDSFFTSSFSFWLYWGDSSFPLIVGSKDDITTSVFIPGDRISNGLRFRCDLGQIESNGSIDVLHYYLKGCYLKLYDMGPSGDTQNHIANQTDQLTNGFDESQGNSVNNDLSSGLNEYQTAEDSLWATATTGLKDFTFFDFESVPAMITGMSFITSIMGSWFSHAGGASGVGIVLSILFSVMLVAMVLGLYRLYQSKGGKK